MRPLFAIALNQLTTVGLGLLGVKLVSEFVPPQVNGKYALFLTLAQIGYLVIYPGVINHAMRYWQRESSNSGVYARFIWLTVWRELKWWGPVLLLVSVAAVWVDGDPVWIWAAPALLVSNLAIALHYIATGALTAAGNSWKVLALTFVGTGARVLLPIAAALLLGMGLLNLAWGYCAHAVIVIAAVAGMFRAAGRAPAPDPTQEARWKTELREYGRPFVLLGIGAWFLMSADRWVVKQFYDDHQAGLFAIASTIGAFVPTIVLGALMQFALPRVFRKADLAKTEQDWRQIASRCDHVTVIFVVLSLAGLVALHWMGPYLVGWLISPTYAEALPMVIPAGMATMTALTNQFYYLLLQGQHNSAAMVRVMTVVAGLKTAGSIAAAAVSFNAFLGWLAFSLLLGAGIGRFMIRRIALKGAGQLGEPGRVEMNVP